MQKKIAEISRKKLLVVIILIVIAVLILIFLFKIYKTRNVEVSYIANNTLMGWLGEIKIKNDGSVSIIEIYSGSGEEKIISNYTGKLNESEIREFNELVNDVEVFKLQEEYICKSNCSADLSSTTLKFTINRKEKTIFMYSPPAPPDSLAQVIQRIRLIKEKFAPEN